jgi:hypothetical protein
MKPLLALLALGSLSSCVVDPAVQQELEKTLTAPQGQQPTAPAYGQPLTATQAVGSVTIREGDRVVATCYTASPNVEQTRFINEQQQIVVKSRGNHGPATVQLFNSRTGSQEGSVMAYEVRNGFPAWAAGMGE